VTLGHTGPAADELTIVWADPFGHLRATKSWSRCPRREDWLRGVHARRPTRPARGILNAIWAVTMNDADGGEPYDVLYYDQIRCL